MIYRLYIKRFVDLSAAIVALVILMPVCICVFLILAIDYRGNPFFFQQRVGRNGKIFTIVKFRTMNERKDVNGNLLPDKFRVTTIGQVVRKTSLDELPQLWNVLVGDMSLVGPRPLLVEYLPLYTAEQNRRHEARPGITGWAQVHGRNIALWQERFRMDVWYVDNCSFILDIRIMLLTIMKVIKAEGVNAGKGITMAKFQGNNEV